jgi:hypothetical protein
LNALFYRNASSSSWIGLFRPLEVYFSLAFVIVQLIRTKTLPCGLMVKGHHDLVHLIGGTEKKRFLFDNMQGVQISR